MVKTLRRTPRMQAGAIGIQPTRIGERARHSKVFLVQAWSRDGADLLLCSRVKCQLCPGPQASASYGVAARFGSED
jgi:hypothetical protein